MINRLTQWVNSWIPHPYVRATYPGGAVVIDREHVVFTDIDDTLPQMVTVRVVWMTPRAHAAWLATEAPF